MNPDNEVCDRCHATKGDHVILKGATAKKPVASVFYGCPDAFFLAKSAATPGPLLG